MKYIVTNFAYGTGPYLRTTELAIAFNNELERRGHSRLPIIVPLVYGEKQKRILKEEFGAHIKSHPEEILLDVTLGGILKEIFYTGERAYEETLRVWLDNANAVSSKAHAHLSGTFVVETFSGDKREVSGGDIVLELNRSPRIRYDVAPSYSTTFGYVADILERSLSVGEDSIAVGRELLKRGVALADSIEGKQDMHCMAYPATFTSESSKYTSRYAGEILVPPITNLPQPHLENMEKGIFVTITGIEGLERLYAEAQTLGLKLYSNDTDAVEDSTKALPHVIPNPAIVLQFARAGWGSIWLSLFTGTPLIVPMYDKTDDPEIYFNNLAVEALGIGIVYKGQPLEELLSNGPVMRERAHQLRAEIETRFGTQNGNEVCARLFADAFLNI